MFRWFKVNYRPETSDHIFTCEVICSMVDGNWTVSPVDHGLDQSEPYHNLWVAIANLFEHNDLEIMQLQEIDRAGNTIYI